MRVPRQRQGSYEAADTEQLGALWPQCRLQWTLSGSPLLMSTVHSTVDSLRMGLHFFYLRSTFFPCWELNLQGRQPITEPCSWPHEALKTPEWAQWCLTAAG